jgi:hypothetical protein
MEAIQHKLFTQITAREDWANIDLNRFLGTLHQIDSKLFLKHIPRLGRYYKSIIDKLLSSLNLEVSIINARYNIPLELLPYFEATESKYEYDSFEFGQDQNLFVWMYKNGITYDIEDFVYHNKVKGADRDRLLRLKKKILGRKLKDFTLLYLGYGECAHFWGTNSRRFGKTLREFSKQIEELYELLISVYPDGMLVVLGDHGMIDVEQYVDVQRILHRLAKQRELKCPSDFIYFVDSTLVRVWMQDKNLIDEFESELLGILGAFVEGESDTQEYLSRFKPKFGDIILLLKPGYVFFPDFFNTKRMLGMHGYLNKYPKQAGTMVVFGNDTQPNIIEAMKLSEVKEWVKSLCLN